jgi:hypothetical protein
MSQNTFFQSFQSSSNMASSSNAATLPPPSGFLAPPTVDMIPNDIPIMDQIKWVTSMCEAYLVYNVLVEHPSPSFILPHSYKILIDRLEPASPEHIKIIKSAIRYSGKSKPSFYYEDKEPYRNNPYLTNETKNVLAGVMSNWSSHSIMTRIFFGLHNYVLTKNIDEDPNPPPPFDPSNTTMLRCASGPCAGTDEYIYPGSYIASLERCFGYEPSYYTLATDTSGPEEHGVDGFLRAFANERVLPALQAEADRLVEAYQAHPIHLFANILDRLLGGVRHQYVLVPTPVSGEPTTEEQEIANVWRSFYTYFMYEYIPYYNVPAILQETADSIPALKSDSQASIIMDLCARINWNGSVLSADLSQHISSFLGTRLPDDAPEFAVRPRLDMFSTENIDQTALQTLAMLNK